MQDFLGPDDWVAVWLSLRIAIVALLGSLPFGILVAYGLARWRFPGWRAGVASARRPAP